MFDIIKKAPQKVVYYDENVYAGPLGHFFSTFLDFKFGLKIELIKCAIFGSDKTAKSDFFSAYVKIS